MKDFSTLSFETIFRYDGHYYSIDNDYSEIYDRWLDDTGRSKVLFEIEDLITDDAYEEVKDAYADMFEESVRYITGQDIVDVLEDALTAGNTEAVEEICEALEMGWDETKELLEKGTCFDYNDED